MPDLLIERLLNYGLGGFAILICLGIILLMIKLERRVLKIEGRHETDEKEQEERDDMCEKHSGYFTKAFKRLDKIELKDVASDGRFDNIDTKLANLDNKMDTISSGVNKIVDHFVSKGMK